ncbi:MAG: hypothetical protein WDO68_17830 [Gammaproteobacteria bacterium]
MSAISREDFRKYMTDYLATELGSREAAESLVPALMESALCWRPDAVPAAKINRIIAYAFGNRSGPKDPKALPFPGPMNEELADTVMRVHKLKPVRIYAQWEIARFLTDKHGLKDVVSIEPVARPDGTLEYLSTDGVARSIIAQDGGDATAMGIVAVVAHADHVQRCVDWSRLRGINAYVAKEVPMPAPYDPLSGQDWTRRRDLYLLHDVLTRLSLVRSQAMAKAASEAATAAV